MMKGIPNKRFALIVGLLIFLASGLYAQTPAVDSAVEMKKSAAEMEKTEKGFTWGAYLGSSVDLTGNDLTTFDANLQFGYSLPYLQMIGVGVGVRRSLGSRNTFVPLDVVVRTNFRRRPSLLFMNFQSGYSFNTISEDRYKGGFQMSLGLGVNLTQSPKLKSYIMLSYGFFHINARQVDNLRMDMNYVNLAQLGIGIQF